MRGVAIALMAMTLTGCVYIGPSLPPMRPLIAVQVPSYAPPDVKTLAQREVRAMKAAPACTGAFGLIFLADLVSIIPYADNASLAIDLAAVKVGENCQ